MSGKDFKIVVLLSGRGSHFRNLLVHAQHYKIIAVFSNKGDAPGLKYATEFNIPAYVFERKGYASRAEQQRALFEKVRDLHPDLIVLAGFMQIIDPEIVEQFPDRMINIHPSRLPEFPGLDTHKRALEAGVKIHGCTVHYVDSGLDSGPIIAQADCEVAASDTEDALAARVLSIEHKLYPWVVNNIALGYISTAGGKVKYDRTHLNLSEHHFRLPKGHS